VWRLSADSEVSYAYHIVIIKGLSTWVESRLDPYPKEHIVVH